MRRTSQNAFKSVSTLILLALVYQIPFLLSFSTPTGSIFGRYTLKYTTFLIAYLLLVAFVGWLFSRILTMTGDAYQALTEQIARRKALLCGAAILAPIGAAVIGYVLERFVYGDVVFSYLVDWLIFLTVQVELLLYLLLPVETYQRAFGPIREMHRRMREGALRGYPRLALWVLAGIASLIPVVWMALNTLAVGEGSAANDQLFWIAIIDKVLSGDYDGSQLPSDSYYQGHALIVPAAIQLADAALFRWNQEVLIVFGFLLSGAMVWILGDIAQRAGSSLPKWVMLPLFSAMLFLPTHLSTFSFGMTPPQMIFANFNLVLGSWALVRFRDSWRGILLICVSGLLAAWSVGNGLLTLPCLFVGLLLIGDRKIGHYVLIVLTMALTAIPTLQLGGDARSVGILRIKEAIGWSFYHAPWPYDDSFLTVAGAIGQIFLICILTATLMILINRDLRNQWTFRLAPGLCLLIFGVGTIAVTTIFRSLLAPWYSTSFMMFWIGIALLACSLWGGVSQQAERSEQTHLQWAIRALFPVWSLSALSMIVLFLVTHRTIGTDTIWLWGRSPAASACWRHYKTAPTSCEWFIAELPPVGKDKWRQEASVLDQHNLTDFAPRQRWTLQGEWALTNVSVDRHGTGDVLWSPGRSIDQQAAWRDYRRLNLMLLPATEIRWTLVLPDEVRHAALHTAVASSEALRGSQTDEPYRFRILLEDAGVGQEPTELYNNEVAGNTHGWHPVSLPLNEYVGQTITLVFTTDMSATAGSRWGVFRYPYVDIAFDEAAMPAQSNKPIMPSNTDLSPEFPQTTAQDKAFKPVTSPAVPPDGQLPPNWEVVGPAPILAYAEDGLQICAANYTHFVFEMAAPATPVGLAVLLSVKSADRDWISYPVTLLHDGSRHGYSIDLRYFEIPTTEPLDALQVWLLGFENTDSVLFEGLRLVRGDAEIVCAD